MLGLLSLVASVGACESPTYPECDGTADVAATPGHRESKCPSSTFRGGDGTWTELRGTVRRGDEGVAEAIVFVEPAYRSDTEPEEARLRTVTDAAGAFTGLRRVPHRFDITVRVDRDVMVYRDVITPFFDPAFEVETTSAPRGWRARVNVATTRPVPEEHALAYFATGVGVVGTEAGDEHGVSIITTSFDASATLHAVEYVRGDDLTSAIAYGKVDLATSAGAARFATVDLQPITAFAEKAMVEVTVPPGFVPPSEVELVVSYSRTSHAPFTKLVPGVPKKLPMLPGATSYGYKARATRPDGAESYSGETFFDAFAESVEVVLPAPPETVDPGDAPRAPEEGLDAIGEGVLEHVLVHERGDSTIRVITTARTAELPPFEAVGLAPPNGRWSWRVRGYPTLTTTRSLSGLEPRRHAAVATSPPRTVTFR